MSSEITIKENIVLIITFILRSAAMKALILTLLVAAATAVPVPEPDNGPVEVIVNGVPEGHALDIDEIISIDVQKKVDGEIVAVDNPLHPFSSAGIIEAAIAAEANRPVPEPVIVEPEIIVNPEIIPDPIILLPAEPIIPRPVPESGNVPDPIVLPTLPVEPELIIPRPVPEPSVVPDSLIPRPVPDPVDPDVIVLPDDFTPSEVLPAPSGIIFNNGVVDVTVNGPTDYNIMGTLKNWFNVVVNYITNGTQASHQVI